MHFLTKMLLFFEYIGAKLHMEYITCFFKNLNDTYNNIHVRFVLSSYVEKDPNMLVGLCLTYLSRDNQFRVARKWEKRYKNQLQSREKTRETYSCFSATNLSKSTIYDFLTIGSRLFLKRRFAKVVSTFWLFGSLKRNLSWQILASHWIFNILELSSTEKYGIWKLT